MNFLAHFELSGDNEQYIVGALLGDFVKGPLEKLPLPADIVRGIKLHRQIDAYTDTLPELLALGKQLPAPYRRYKGILSDLFFDYALVRNWHHFRNEPLEHYANRIHDTLSAHQHQLVPPALVLFQRMQRYDLLCRYNEKSVIDGVVKSIGVRLTKEAQLQAACEHMWELEESWEAAFMTIYPDIKRFAQMKLQNIEMN